jgi:hypothetical protein
LLREPARCVVKSVSNVIHLLIEAEPGASTLKSYFADRDIISSVRYRVTAPCQSSFLYYPRDTDHPSLLHSYSRLRADRVLRGRISIFSDYRVDARESYSVVSSVRGQTRSSRNSTQICHDRRGDIGNDFSYLSSSRFRSKLQAFRRSIRVGIPFRSFYPRRNNIRLKVIGIAR